VRSGALSGDPAEPRRSPYQGLVPYSEADSAYFFGREGWRDLVIDNLVAYRLTVLYGTSGVGKSSLIRAGVMPALRARALRSLEAFGRAELAPVAFGSWKLDPLEGLKEAIRTEIEAFAPKPAVDPAPEPLAAMLEDAGRRIGGRVLVILDQFEDYLAYHPLGHPLVDELAAALGRRDVPANFLISIREDALAKLDRLEEAIPFVWRNLLRVEQLDAAAGRLAIVSPLGRWELDHTGDRVEADDDLVEDVLEQVTAGRVHEEHEARGVVDEHEGRVEEDVSTDGTIEAPYLQLVMTRLWDEERARGSRRLSLGTLRRLGGAEPIVRSHLDQTMAALPRRERALASRLFTYLVTPTGTKIALPAAALAKWSGRDEDKVTRVLDHLARGEARILRAVPAPGGGPASYEIFHDRLVPGILAWRRRYLARRRRRRVALALGVAALIALALGVYSLRARALADLRRAAVAQNEEASAQYLRTVLRGHRGALTGAEFSPDGSRVLTAASDGTARLWTALSGQQLFLFRAGGNSAATARFSPGGTRAAVYDEQELSFWDLLRGSRIGTIDAQVAALDFSPDGRSLAVATLEGLRIFRDDLRSWRPAPGGLPVDFDPNGRRLAVGGSDDCVDVYDVRSLRLVNQYCLAPEIDSVRFSPDGSKLALDNGVDTVRLFSLRGRPSTDLHTGPSLTGNIDPFSPDGRLLVSTTHDDPTAVLVWDLRTRKRLGVLRGHSEPVSAFAFSPDGKRLATAAEDGTARIWDLRTRRPMITLAGHRGPVVSVAFSPDGRFVVTASVDRTARIWQIVRAKPDLAVASADVSTVTTEAGRIVRVEVAITNKGEAKSPATSVEALLEGDGGEDVATTSARLEPLTRRGRRELRFELAVPDTAPQGEYELVLIVDPPAQVDEATKENNVVTRKIDLPAPPSRQGTVTVTVPVTVTTTETVVETAPEIRTVTETVTQTVTVTEPSQPGGGG
jgi:WD40 repeat protein